MSLAFFEPVVVGILMLCAVVSLPFCVEGMRKTFYVKGSAWLFLLLITFTGAWLRFHILIPHHIITFDEYSHISIARILQKTGNLCEIKKGSLENPETCAIPGWPCAYHVALSFIFSFSGFSDEKTAFLFSSAIGTLSVLIIGIAGFGIWKSPLPGMFAALFLALSGPHLLFSVASETGIYSSFLVIAVLCVLMLYYQMENLWSALALVAVAGLAVFARFENMILFLFIPWALYYRNKRLKPFLYLSPLILIIVAVFFSHVFFAIRNTQIGSVNLQLQSRFGETLFKNLYYWIAPGRGNSNLFVFFAVGMLYRLRGRMYLCALPILYLLFLSAYGKPFGGGIGDSRFLLSLLPLYLLVAGAGTAYLIGLLPCKRFQPAAAGIFATVFAGYFAGRAGYLNSFYPEEAKKAEKCRTFLAETADKLPKDLYFLTYAPSYIACGASRKVALPDNPLGRISGPALFSKDVSWDDIFRQYPDVEKKMRGRYIFKLLASDNNDGKIDMDTCAVYLLESK